MLLATSVFMERGFDITSAIQSHITHGCCMLVPAIDGANAPGGDVEIQ